jgi:hypothetical protein
MRPKRVAQASRARSGASLTTRHAKLGDWAGGTRTARSTVPSHTPPCRFPLRSGKRRRPAPAARDGTVPLSRRGANSPRPLVPPLHGARPGIRPTTSYPSVCPSCSPGRRARRRSTPPLRAPCSWSGTRLSGELVDRAECAKTGQPRCGVVVDATGLTQRGRWRVSDAWAWVIRRVRSAPLRMARLTACCSGA